MENFKVDDAYVESFNHSGPTEDEERAEYEHDMALESSKAVETVDRVGSIRYAYNESGKDKEWGDYTRLTEEFKDTVGDLTSVMDHVKAGHALCAGTLNNSNREKPNFAGSQWILIDIDNTETRLDEKGQKIKEPDGTVKKFYTGEMTLDAALNHEFVKDYCSLIYTSYSHKEDWHRFRLVFLLPEFVKEAKTYEAAVLSVMQWFPADNSCKDCVRVFYGASNASFPLINPDVCLHSNFVSEAKLEAKRREDERATELAKRKARHESYKASGFKSNGLWDQDKLVEDALSVIPERMIGGNNYDQCLLVLQALHSHYGDAGIPIAELWSPSQPGTSWDIAYKFNSFRKSGIELRTLFWIAQKYGFKYPEGYKNEVPTLSLTADEIKNHKPDEEKRFSWDSVREGFPADITEAYEKANSYRAIEPDVVALGIVTVLSSELGGICDTDTGSPINISAAVVGVSGSGKSGKIEATVKGLSTVDESRHLDFVAEELAYKRDVEEHESRKKDIKASGRVFDEPEPVKPTENFTIIQGITGECLVMMLQDQEEKSRGLLNYHDELITFIGGLDKYNKSGDERSRTLSIHSGALTRTNTKSGGAVRVKSPRMSIFGGIQPVVLMKEVNRMGNEDGWWARFLLAKTYKIKVVKRFNRMETQAKYIQLVVEKYVNKIQQISGRLRSEMTEETIDLREEMGQLYCDETDIASNEEAHLKTIDHIDRVATVLSLLEYIYLGLSGDLAPVYPHHYRAALALCENSLSIWEELNHVDTAKSDVELVNKAHKLGKKKNRLDAKILQNWATGEKAQNIIKLVYETYGGQLTTSRQDTFTWTP